MKKVYIVLTHTGTLLSRMIKGFTKDEFTHSSIALDVELKQMYSFGRLNAYNPFIGGFVHESIHNGTFGRFYNTQAKIYALEITDKQYESIQKRISQIETAKENYTFNVWGLFAAGFHKRIGKEHSFYCAEFVKYILENSGIQTNLPEIIKPEDFKKLENLELIYEGYLRKYVCPKVNIPDFIRENLLLYRKKEGVV